MAENTQNVFQRIETKYLLKKKTYEQFVDMISSHMELDQYGRHTICNIYYDTDQYALISRSIEKPGYKEKLRLRSYGVPTKEQTVFIEIKKKYQKIVYKRRAGMPLETAMDFLDKKGYPKEYATQITKEIQYFLDFYQPIPKLYLAYDREAYFGKENSEIRMTFDQNIRYRETNLDLLAGDYGEKLLEEGERLLEIKVPGALPLWLAKALSELEIYPVSFSKYGNIYKKTHLQSPVMRMEKTDIYMNEGGIISCLQV